AFTRVVFGSASNKATAMPAGRVAGGVFENRGGRAVTLFHSVDIAPGQSTILIPRAPAVGTSDVFAELIAPADKRLPVDEVDVAPHVRSDKTPEMFIDVQRPAENKPLNHVAIRNDENTRIESLEPNSYDVFLRLSRWKLRKSVDLRNGHDATVDFDVTPIEIH